MVGGSAMWGQLKVGVVAILGIDSPNYVQSVHYTRLHSTALQYNSPQAEHKRTEARSQLGKTSQIGGFVGSLSHGVRGWC